jgi:hypothetical protein
LVIYFQLPFSFASGADYSLHIFRPVMWLFSGSIAGNTAHCAKECLEPLQRDLVCAGELPTATEQPALLTGLEQCAVQRIKAIGAMLQ